MDSSYEKKAAVTTDTVSSHSDHTAVTAPRKKIAIYDPSKETKWTRAGLSLESFKRAPGPTGSVSTLNILLLLTNTWHGREQVIAGHANLDDIEGDMPVLQPKMKSRHLNMIAVGQSYSSLCYTSLVMSLYTRWQYWHRSLRRFWIGSSQRRPCWNTHRVYSDRRYAD